MRTVGMVVVGCVTICGFLLSGCEGPTQRLNAPPQGHSAHPSELQGNYTPMTDNALLADMCMSPSDFVPHQPELNSKGARRLTRYAEILKTYEGTLNYDGFDDPDRLAKDRIKKLEDFLVAAGLERGKFTVARGVAGGSGMQATEAMGARAAAAGPDAKSGGGLSDTGAVKSPGQSASGK